MDKAKIKETALGGLLRNNPTFVLVLGTCPTIATTSSLFNSFAMGVATMFVLVFSNLFISLLRRVIPERVRIPCYIVIVSTFVTIVQMVMRRFLPDLYTSIGTFIDLIVVNCIILARAESYAACNKPLYSMLDGVSMGVGFTCALCLIGIVREFLAGGAFAGFAIPGFPVMDATAASVFGFIVFGCLMALFNFLVQKWNARARRAEQSLPLVREGAEEVAK